MSTDQLRRRTSALKLPEDIYKQYDEVVKSCDGMVDVEGGKKKLALLIIFDGAMSIAYVVNTMNSKETISLFLEYCETYQINPKTIVGDQAFMQPDFEDFHARRNITVGLLH